MYAISLWQPWASLWVLDGVKDHETRHWRFPKRLTGKRVLVHAAKKAEWPYEGDPLDSICVQHFGIGYRKELPRGAFVGSLVLAACVPSAQHPPLRSDDWWCGNWDEGRFGWLKSEPVRLPAPVTAKGQQGFWNQDGVI